MTVAACGTNSRGSQAPDKQALNSEDGTTRTSAGAVVTHADSSKGNNGKKSTGADSASNSADDKLQNKIDLAKKVSFTAQTPFGDSIDSSIFANYDITMINIWGTLCKPCIKEMPELQKLYDDMKSEKVNIIGFIVNYQDDRVEKAKEILTELKITFSNAIFDDEVSGTITSQVPGYPTTVFVDSKGNIVGDQVTGAHSFEEYKAIIKERLEESTS